VPRLVYRQRDELASSGCLRRIKAYVHIAIMASPGNANIAPGS
jgi:hypothetical protein